MSPERRRRSTSNFIILSMQFSWQRKPHGWLETTPVLPRRCVVLELLINRTIMVEVMRFHKKGNEASGFIFFLFAPKRTQFLPPFVMANNRPIMSEFRFGGCSTHSAQRNNDRKKERPGDTPGEANYREFTRIPLFGRVGVPVLANSMFFFYLNQRLLNTVNTLNKSFLINVRQILNIRTGHKICLY